ncbi:MAG TPA: hypothetical protein VFV76_06525 [Actinomycetes bacterium]|nr:hypothetical protein [Actinomycetes bacterium]
MQQSAARQSIVPPLRILIPSVVGMLLVLGAAYFAVAAAIEFGGEDCAGTKNEVLDRCR